ncbi:MAG: GNAT family N-acetyltransferase [Clostridia bacterium]|nr:GNAT family N-acetyltransferase [Clostridia bacterium]
MIREARESDLVPLLELYLHLHESRVPEDSEHLRTVWQSILRDENHHLIVCEEDGKIVSSCVCVVILNLTRNVRPYALIENVVTHPDYRKRGLASQCLRCATEIAKRNDCYKIMLLTGAKDESTLDFYRKAGFNNGDKTAFVQWI